MTKSRRKQWNPTHLSKCADQIAKLIGGEGEAVHLLAEAAVHLTCGNTGCREYRRLLKEQADWLLEEFPLASWEFWVLKAAEQMLQTEAGTKLAAVSMMALALDEYDAICSDSSLRSTWDSWYRQHRVEEPMYI